MSRPKEFAFHEIQIFRELPADLEIHWLGNDVFRSVEVGCFAKLFSPSSRPVVDMFSSPPELWDRVGIGRTSMTASVFCGLLPSVSKKPFESFSAYLKYSTLEDKLSWFELSSN